MAAHVRCLVAVVVLAVSFSSSAAAQPNTWSSLGPFGGSILSLAKDPSSASIVYAVADRAGGFKSLDGGQSWTLITGSLSANAQVRSIAVSATNPQTLYLGSYSGGVHKSTNGGQTWTEITTLPRLAPQAGGRDGHAQRGGRATSPTTFAGEMRGSHLLAVASVGPGSIRPWAFRRYPQPARPRAPLLLSTPPHGNETRSLQ